jgi:tetratricopeptide (TPR) repeat protein
MDSVARPLQQVAPRGFQRSLCFLAAGGWGAAAEMDEQPWPVLQLDLSVQAEAEALAVAQHEGTERARQLRLGLVPPPNFGGLARAIDWLESGKQRYAEHEYERGVVELGNAVAIAQLGLRPHADASGLIHRSGESAGGDEAVIGPLADDVDGSARDPEDVGVLLDACFWRAACHRGMGMVDRALPDIDRLIGWHRRGEKIATLHALRALCQFEALQLPGALDDARRAVALSPDSREIQDLLAELVAYTTTALGEGVTAATRGGVALRYVRLRGHEIFHELGGEGYVLYEIGIRLPALQPELLSGWSAKKAAGEAEVTVYKRFSEVLDLHTVVKAAMQNRPQPDAAGGGGGAEPPAQGRMSFGFGFGGGASKPQAPKMPRPPSRMLLATKGKFDESLLRERTAQLQTYFDALLEVPGIDTLPEFLAFFAT